jgi:ssDNA-binding Zn-finger/Zn-ribbon topoisomerase 1
LEILFWIAIAIWILGKIIGKTSSNTSRNGNQFRHINRGSNYYSGEKNIGVECPEGCGGLIMELLSKKGNTYYRCGYYPVCDFVAFDLPIGVKCPNEGCDGTILEKKSRSGNIFYGCNSYPSCKFSSSKKPVSYSCPNCGSGILVKDSTLQNKQIYTCPFCSFQSNSDIISIPCYNCGEKSLYEKELDDDGLFYICKACNYRAAASDYK